eukprot:TRINITY_DN71310_c0_g1_i1.p1 TRINITY_DN71310_c0_g1~~TRINITY_DN71310_c0_g1_i1.p1  ORF type:complete len:679 (-),score=184.72 TRINITY_DN71310_c0_g1_i1:78-2114(-)
MAAEKDDDSSSSSNDAGPMPAGAPAEQKGEKRPLDNANDDDSSSNDAGPMPAGAQAGGAPAPGGGDDDSSDDCGPMPMPAPVAQKVKKKKVLKKAHVFIDNLPKGEMYEKSFMHRDVVTHCVFSSNTGFLITGSADGHIKFWKKQFEGIEFVKHYRSHVNGALTSMALSPDGRLLVTVGEDSALKLYDVNSFDMTCMLKLGFKPLVVEFVHKKNSPQCLVAVSDADTGKVHVIAPETGKPDPVRTLEVHGGPVHAIKYNPQLHACLSADRTGALELWDPDTLKMPTSETRPGRLRFEIKSETHLYELLKNQTFAISIGISADGTLFVLTCDDGRLRVFRFATAKMVRAYDESLEMFTAAQSDPNMADLHLDRFDFGRRVAVEKEMRKSKELMLQQACFDESGNFLVYTSMVGVKIINIHTNKLVRVLGKVEQTERFLGMALCQGKLQRRKAATGESVMEGDHDKESADPLCIVTAYKKPRFFVFSSREPPETTADYGRDIFNEKPSKEDAAVAASIRTENPLGKQATIHTTMGDIVVKLFFQECPKTVENFTVHSKNGYFDNLIFHRVIQGFMIQTGDPQGDGTGGESIWGGEFEDEFHRSLKHDRPFTLSMANAGPNTNGSQFFITTVPCPWLDGKHTVFGRVLQGMDVVQNIEKSPCNCDDRPLLDIKIMAVKIIS